MQNRILKDLKTKTKEQLEKEVGEKVGQINRLSAELATGRVKNVREVKAAKVYLARVKTLLRELELNEKLVVSERKRVEP